MENRVIKFRCFYRGEMKQVQQIDMYGDGSISIDKFVGSVWSPDSEHCSELMQFTGLLDRNGKEIYEGDIVKVWHRREHKEGFFTTGVVNYSPAEFYITGDYYTITCHFHYNNSDREVLGNKYENPELLKTFKS